jgi:hypothetical protein
MDRALAADRRVLVDLPAQSARLLQRWMDAGDVVQFAKDMDVRMLFWHVTDGGFDSVKELERLVKTFGSTLQYVVAKNLGRSSDFRQLDQSPAVQALVAAGGRIVEIPALDSATMYEIDRYGSSFWAAINASEGEWALSPSARRRTKHWLERCFAALEGVSEWL